MLLSRRNMYNKAKKTDYKKETQCNKNKMMIGAKKYVFLAATLLAIASLVAVVGTATTTAFAQPNERVTICHNGEEITVSERAVAPHVRNHGDTIGACVDEEPVLCFTDVFGQIDCYDIADAEDCEAHAGLVGAPGSECERFERPPSGAFFCDRVEGGFRCGPFP